MYPVMIIKFGGKSIFFRIDISGAALSLVKEWLKGEKLDPNYLEVFKVKATKGRRSIVDHNPEIIEYLREFIDNAGSPSAHPRLKDDIEYIQVGCKGVTLHAMTQHIKNKLAGKEMRILEISLSTVRRLLLPPHMHRLASKTYRKLVNAKIYQSSNTIPVLIHAEDHWANAQVKYVMNYCSRNSTRALKLRYLMQV